MTAPVEHPPQAKLNILALPSHTALLFGLIALIVLGAAFSSLLPGAQLWPLPILLGFTLLPLRDFLHRPDRHIARAGLSLRADPAAVELQGALRELAPALTPPVAIAVGDRPAEAHAFGTFRRRYIGLGRNLAVNLRTFLRSPDAAERQQARAVLAHELAHFLNRDVQLVWLAYGLLKMMVLVMAVNLVVSILLSAFVIEVGPEVFRPEFWAALSRHLAGILPGLPTPDLGWIFDSLRAQNSTLVDRLADPARQIENWQPFFIYLAGSHTPFFLSGAVLLGYYWRRLLRVREFYADARAAALVGNAAVVPEALVLHKYAALMAPVSSAAAGSFRSAAPTRSTLGERLAAFRRSAGRWRRAVGARLPGWPAMQRQLALAPSDAERQACLVDPLVAFGSERVIAVSAGLAVILLDLILRGTLTAARITEPGAHLPMLTGFAVLSLWCLPRVCAGQTLRRHLARSILSAVGVFTGIKLLMHFVDFGLGLAMMARDPAAWGHTLDLWVYSMVGGVAPDLPSVVGVAVTWPQIIEWHTVRPMIYFGLLMPPTLVAWLVADAALKRRALTWYALGARVRRVFWAIAGVLALLLALAAIPCLNRLIFPYIYTAWSAGELIGAGLALLVAFAGGTLFWFYDRRLVGRCSRCKAQVTEPYAAGQYCESCGGPLHDWLVLTY
jgi:Zn-dependent protease with chaperone function